MDEIQKQLLKEIAGLHDVPQGAYNFRVNGQGAGRQVTENINIVTKEDKPGIDIRIKAGTKKESVHIPVILSQTGLSDLVYNDFYIGEDADVTIVAGCGIHNSGSGKSQHDGIHTFHVGKNAKLKYVEKHYGGGDGSGERVLNPETIVYIAEGGIMEMDTVQIKGVDSAVRTTRVKLGKAAVLKIKEKILTHGGQNAETYFEIDMDGEGCGAHVVSRAVARDHSKQLFTSKISGNARCMGHTECDAILMEDGKVSAVPEISANHLDASLIHEAAIGKIAGEQIIKLMTLGLTEKEAESEIINGFLV